MTTAVKHDIADLISALEAFSTDSIVVRGVSVTDRRDSDERSLVTVVLSEPRGGPMWDLGEFDVVRTRVRDLVSTSSLGSDARITYSSDEAASAADEDPTATKVASPGPV